MSASTKNKKASVFGFFWNAGAGLLKLTSLAGAGWILYSNLVIDHAVPLDNALLGNRISLENDLAGKVNIYASETGTGRPLVLLHSINAAASAYEMKPIFDHYQGKRPVYALEWPGFGKSERKAVRYSPDLYSRVLNQFIESLGGKTPDVIALSLGSEFAARAASLRPELFHSLVLISPSGLGKSRGGRNENQTGQLHSILSAPLWGRPLYDLVATRVSIRWFLKKSFVGEPPQDLVDYCYASAHQPGAQNAPLFFLSGSLFTANVLESIYMHLQVPTRVIYDQDFYVRFDRLEELLNNNSNFSASRLIPSRGLPQFEMLDELTSDLDRYWDSLSK